MNEIEQTTNTLSPDFGAVQTPPPKSNTNKFFLFAILTLVSVTLITSTVYVAQNSTEIRNFAKESPFGSNNTEGNACSIDADCRATQMCYQKTCVDRANVPSIQIPTQSVTINNSDAQIQQMTDPLNATIPTEENNFIVPAGSM